MNESRASRWLIWTGPLFALLFFVSGLVLDGSPPGEKAAAGEVVKYFNAHQDRTLTEVFLAPAAATLILLFAAELRSRARARQRERGLRDVGPTVMVGGAVLIAAALLGGAVLDLALATASDHHQAQVAQTLNVLSNDNWLPGIGGIAIFLIGSGMTVLNARLVPAWLGWVAVVVGVVSLAGPGGFLGFFGAPLWILVAGVLLAMRSDRAPAVTAASEPSQHSQPMPSDDAASRV